jgi:hypothetical protein
MPVSIVNFVRWFEDDMRGNKGTGRQGNGERHAFLVLLYDTGRF